MTIYDGYQTWNQNEYPTILAIGDSWFWYPRNNLLEALANHAKLKNGYEIFDLRWIPLLQQIGTEKA